ncbi:MAG: PEP-CTERM sorting domain-containing protein [Candidatus Omnitrophota bacterium]
MKKLFIFTAVFFLAAVAHSAPITFFGEDLGLGESTRLTSYPSANSARSNFLAPLIGVGTEDFEGLAGEDAPVTLTFPGAGDATLLGDGFVDTVLSGTNGVGRYAISGVNYWESSSSFSIEFSDPVAAFGFYGIDIGDFDGQLTLSLINSSTTTDLIIPNTINGSGGSVLYFGVIDKDNPFTELVFGNTEPGVDYFGFDDMTIGSVEQVGELNGVVPEPATLFLLGSGLVGLAGVRTRKKK